MRIFLEPVIFFQNNVFHYPGKNKQIYCEYFVVKGTINNSYKKIAYTYTQNLLKKLKTHKSVVLDLNTNISKLLHI